MPSDVKCGLLVAIAVVLAVALLFFRKEVPKPHPEPLHPAAPPTASSTGPKSLTLAEPVSHKRPN